MKIISIYRSFLFLIKLLYYKLFGALESFYFSYRNHCGTKVKLAFDRDSKVKLGKNIGLRDNVLLSVRSNATLIIGDDVFINNGCSIVSHDYISIGDATKIGPNVMMFDHDYNYKTSGGVSAKEYITASIIIGRNCWIGAGTILLRGTEVGDNCVIGAGSVIKGKFPNNSIIVQKRTTTVSSYSK